MKNCILLSHNLIECQLPANENQCFNVTETKYQVTLGTILSNMAFYGFKPSKELYLRMNGASQKELCDFWAETEPKFEEFFKNFIKAKNGVVYKNFPAEVLTKSDAEYWIAQMFIYMDVSSDLFAQEEVARPKLDIDLNALTVLHVAKEDSLSQIYQLMLDSKTSFNSLEKTQIDYLIKHLNIQSFNFDETPFKSNGAFVAAIVIEQGGDVVASNATDVMRVGVELCHTSADQPIFKFSRPQRRALLKMLCLLDNYEEDLASRKKIFKLFMRALRPGDYAWAKKASEMYDRLYNKKIKSFLSKVECSETPSEMLSQRAGMFIRAFHKMYDKNAEQATQAMLKTISQKEESKSLKVAQLLKFKKYILNIENVSMLIARPSSNWSKSKLIENKKIKIADEHKKAIIEAIDKKLSEKLNARFPNGVMKGADLDKIKIKSNDQEISVGRGTAFDLPENVKFIRTATYWENNKPSKEIYCSNFWFDNGINFIHSSDPELNKTTCWDSLNDKDLACFSGDPAISKNEKNMAAQIIDISLDMMKEQGYKYAVWSVLSYNNILFSAADHVWACAQFVEDQNVGELFEPSRAAIQFELKGKVKNKLAAYIDIEERKLVILDLSFSGLSTHSAKNNKERLVEIMPALLDHIDLIPSVADLVENIKDGDVPFVFTDLDLTIEDGSQAFVFQNKNEENKFEQIHLDELLNL